MRSLQLRELLNLTCQSLRPACAVSYLVRLVFKCAVPHLHRPWAALALLSFGATGRSQPLMA